ncbi:hypothetical protein CMUST_14375 [Corynebacterium mustelae]|uniref:Uncharacterized protein n=1 Tax=Corynebacterium mustelae TaxID=571915 RepID=A0A0G3H5S3_9CORY|nr:hypothetical protein [Corynebacterium mustelae]AKK07168.1 hypothetical protein CMUST_14375 [Corynebacterium mustelae]
MRAELSKRLVAASMVAILPMANISLANAQPVTYETQDSAQQLSAVEFENATQEEQVEALAELLKEMDEAGSEAEVQQLFVERFGQDNLEDAAAQLGTNTSEVFRESDEVVEEGFGEFLQCIKGKATNDIKKALDVNVVAAFIGQKDYAKAAWAIVKHLAKQGIKRNAFAIAGMLAWWAWQCRHNW